MLFSESFFKKYYQRTMQKDLDIFRSVIQTYGVNRAAVKHALRMRRHLLNEGDVEGATEWHVFALAILRRLKRLTYKRHTIH
jgi:hypothetical protein